MRSRIANAAVPALVAGLLFAAPAGAIGLLVPSQPGIPSLKLASHRVEVDITERGARTRVTQEFVNPTGRQLEGTYLFPMPKGATVDEFALWMNGKRETGKVMERKKARQIYESIVRRARDPGLIEYVDSELFQARVFPIPANGKMKVELIYTNLVDYDAGVHRYVYPMKTDQRATTTLDDFTLTVRVKNKLPIKNVYSPSHRVATQRKGKTAAASFEKHAFSLADDFSLYWSVDDDDVGVTVLSYQEGDDAGYFMLLASPKDGYRDSEIIGKRLSLVVDTSGSMAGAKMDATKRALDYILSQLGGDDLFNVITFGGFVETFSERMQSASRANVAKARKFVKQIEPLGGTNIDEALQAALKGATGSKKAPHMVVFLTDGRPTVGETEVNSILSRAQAANDGARVFVFGVGEDVNTILLDKIATENGGQSTYLAGDASVEGDLKRFYDRVSHPVLSDLDVKVSGVRVFGTHPRKYGHLFSGGQLAVLGRYRGGGKATVTLTGTTPRGRKSFKYDARFAKSTSDHTFIPRLWAQRQVGMLLAEIREKGESKGLVDEVTQLATAFGIVTPYTSYLVVEPNMTAPVGRPDRPRPEPMPPPTVFRRGGPGGGEGFGAFAPEDDADMEAPAEAAAPMTGGSGARWRAAKPKKGSRAREMLRKSEGEEAVAAAKEIGRLRDSNVSERKVTTTVARALGRRFDFAAGVWVDERCGDKATGKAKKKVKTLQLKVYSKAFFRVLKRRPDLKKAFALGESVRVEARPGRCLEVSPKGPEGVSDSKVDAFIGGS
jgi:Ca-activated chloride channel family protein